MNEPAADTGTHDEAGIAPRSPVVAVLASTVFHVAIAAALVAMGVTAARAMRREAPPVLVAEWTPPPPPGVVPAPPELPVPGGSPLHVGPAGRARVDAASAAKSAAERLARMAPEPSGPSAPAPRIASGLGFEDVPAGSFRAASFATDRARVAFVVDAGGRLLGALPAARSVLAQRLAALDAQQRFVLVVARGGGIEVAPGTPAAATRGNVAAALAWFTERAAPGGTADLGAALERAWTGFDPDAVCLVARGVPASRRPAARSPFAGLAAAADRLNPPGASGARAASFLCIELAEASADGTLRAVGTAHGGPAGYLLLDRAALGLVPARRPAPASQRSP